MDQALFHNKLTYEDAVYSYKGLEIAHSELEKEGWKYKSVSPVGYASNPSSYDSRAKIYIRHPDLNLIGRHYCDTAEASKADYFVRRPLDYLVQEHNRRITRKVVNEETMEVVDTHLTMNAPEVVSTELGPMFRCLLSNSDASIKKYVCVGIPEGLLGFNTAHATLQSLTNEELYDLILDRHASDKRLNPPLRKIIKDAEVLDFNTNFEEYILEKRYANER